MRRTCGIPIRRAERSGLDDFASKVDNNVSTEARAFSLMRGVAAVGSLGSYDNIESV